MRHLSSISAWRVAVLAGVGLAALGQGGVAWAQDAGVQASAGDDIIVTARRREETLQSVPVSVTALSGEALRLRGYQTITDIQQTTPNLNFTPGTGGTSSQISAYVRGVGEYDYIITSDPAVAVFVDGVYQARPFGALTSLLGIERVEVLRGPQGSLFGKNTIGGAINIVLQKPTGSGKGQMDLEVGSYGSIQGRASYDGALTQNLSYLVSVLGRRSDGWQHLAGGGSLGNQKQFAGRGALRYHSGDFDAVLSVDGLHQRQNSAAHSMIAFEPTDFSNLFSAFIQPCCTVPSSIRKTDANKFLNIDNADGIDASLTLDFPLLGGHLKSISAIRHSSVTFARDGDASQALYAGDRQHIRGTQYSQEFQLSHDLWDGRVKTLFGLYGFYEKVRQQTTLITAYGLYDALVAIGTPPEAAAQADFNIDFDQTQKTKNFAVFGNATIQVTDPFSVDIGARYTWEHKDFVQTADRILAGVPLITVPPGYTSDLDLTIVNGYVLGYHLKDTWRNFSPKITLNYEVAPDVRLYALWSKGFRSGGFNGRPISVDAIGGFNPEKLTSFEGGIKSDLFDRRLRLNFSGFYNKYRNMQVQVNFPTPNGIVSRTENAGRARIWGFELETRLKATPWLTFDGSVGYLNARYEEYMSVDGAGNPIDLSNLRLRHTPPWTASLGATANIPVSEHVGSVFRVDGSYEDRQYVEVQNSPLLYARSMITLNASLEFNVDNGISFGIVGQNLTNKQVIKEGFDSRGSFGFVEAYYNPPRRIYANVRYAF